MPASLPPPAHLAVRLRSSVSALMRRLREGAGVDALAPAKWSVLAQLLRSGPLAPTELARRQGVRLQTLTRLLAELENAGLLLRSVASDDARGRVLTLTTAGRILLTAEVHRREASLRGAVQAALGADERLRLLEACALLDRVAQAMARPADAERVRRGSGTAADRSS